MDTPVNTQPTTVVVFQQLAAVVSALSARSLIVSRTPVPDSNRTLVLMLFFAVFTRWLTAVGVAVSRRLLIGLGVMALPRATARATLWVLSAQPVS